MIWIFTVSINAKIILPAMVIKKSRRGPHNLIDGFMDKSKSSVGVSEMNIVSFGLLVD